MLLLDEYYQALQDHKDAEAKFKAVESRLIDAMEAAERKSTSQTINGVTVKVTYVQRTTTSLDEAGLKKALGAARWNKVSKSVVDRRKLEQAMEDGTIDPMVVGQHLQQNLSKPYLRISEQVAEDV